MFSSPSVILLLMIEALFQIELNDNKLQLINYLLFIDMEQKTDTIIHY